MFFLLTGEIILHCTNCGAVLQPGVANCTNCGVPVTQTPPASQGAYDPTIVAPSPPYGTPPQSGTSYNPYGDASQAPNPYGNAPQAPNPYGSVPQAANPYGNAPVTPNAYGQPVATSYGSGQPYDNAGYTPPVPPVGQPVPPPYGYPQGQPLGGYAPGVPVPGGYGMMPPPPKKRSRIGLIIGIVLGVLLLACVGIILVIPKGAPAPSVNGVQTPAVTPTPNTPSGKSFVASAAAIISNIKTSTAIDANLEPTGPTSTFKAGQTVYVTFNIDSGSNDGYIAAKWYTDGRLVDTKIFHHTHGNTVAYASIPYPNATTKGAAELYWCTQADCADAQLAQATTFTVGATSLVPTSPASVVLQDADRRLF